MFFRSRAKRGADKSAAVDDMQDIGQRSLIRMIFAATGLTLGVFCMLQFMAGNYLFASFELLVTGILLWGAWRIIRVRNLLPWVYLYLLPTFSFLLYIIVIPNASKTAFVWVYSIPVLSYLLLGRTRGSLLALPFVLGACLLYLYTYPLRWDAEGLIDLGNAVFCGVMIIIFVHLYETRRALAHQQLQQMARTDALTGVASRGSFQQSLEQSVREVRRSQGRLVLVILDVDHFKAVNDQYGHDAGDQALRHICNSLSQRLRNTDSLGRLGGEEFGLLLRNTDQQAAVPLVEMLREQIASRALLYGEQQIFLSVTLGLAEWPTDGESAEQLYRCADKRLYRGKEQGRNRLVYRDSVIDVSRGPSDGT
ncbi:GGDEF domain-containing protein [Pseudomonas sp. HMWF032]|uniref:GGDEF domain-containing protein n=1 Tax=unclassified Pseudomonas TaxID=196821 RepID=UPI000D337C50|nr:MULTISPECIES: GGDEF domain-containing protein [unclassified Pseudomonas]PTS83365.1 GGDEF domain-containing protein [Pseudomonas sp. HMWF032]PTT82142.1 GGDEF domain-containing protein [Pseudomonas sp. HMWF010]WAC45650.1 GGDEF domain-containing protein [Pseudomonas sp. SL4(2022)]